MLSRVLSVAVLPVVLGAFDPATYARSEVIDEAAGVKVYWKRSGSLMQLALSAKTEGWVGFGLAEPTVGGMAGADIMTGHVAVDGTTSINDMFAMGLSPPTKDCSQDWTLVAGEKEGGVMTLEVSRAVTTADETQDRPFMLESKQPIIVAWGSSDTVNYHVANRRATAVWWEEPTGTSIEAIKADPTIQSFDVLNNYTMTGQETAYKDISAMIACVDNDAAVLQTANLTCAQASAALGGCDTPAKQDNPTTLRQYGICPRTCGDCTGPSRDIPAGSYHIVAIEHLINDHTAEHVHHFTLRGEYADGKQHEVYAWARGASEFTPPEECGFRFGPGSIEKLQMQTHYDNKGAKNVGLLDQSGIRIYYTETLRANDCGVIQLGDPSVKAGVLNAGLHQSTFECQVPADMPDLQAFASFLHMHEVGKRIWTDQERGGEIIGQTARIDFWDDGFQVLNPTAIVVKGGDVLRTTCIHQATTPTEYGPDSDQEMCIDFLFYWPRREGVDKCGLGSQGGSQTVNQALTEDPITFGTCTQPPTPTSTGADDAPTSVKAPTSAKAPTAGSVSAATSTSPLPLALLALVLATARLN